MNISHDAIFLSISIISFILGFIVARLTNNTTKIAIGKSSKTTKQNTIQSNIDIDDKKVVVNIKTDDLEKKYDNLGEKTQSSDTITSSVSKLKNIKR